MSNKSIASVFVVLSLVNGILAVANIVGRPTAVGVLLYIFYVVCTVFSGALAYSVGKEDQEPFEIPEERRIRLVLAGNHRQYIDYIKTNNLSREKVRYISRPEDVLGFHAERVDLVRVGTFWENPLCDTSELRILEQEIAYANK